MVQKVNLEMTEGVQEKFDTVTEALEKFDTVTEALDKRTIYVGSVSELVAIPVLIDGAHYDVTGYHPDSDYGGGVFYWDASRDKEDHNGGTVIDPDKTFPADFSVTADVAAWLTADGVGSGCFVRPQKQKVMFEDYGCLSNDESLAPTNKIIIEHAKQFEPRLYGTPGKTYWLPLEVDISGSCSFYGQQATLKLAGTTEDLNWILANQMTGGKINGFTLDGNRNNTPNIGIDRSLLTVYNTEDMDIEKLVIVDAFSKGISVTSSLSGTGTRNIRLREISARNCGEQCIIIDSTGTPACEDILIDSIFVRDTDHAGIAINDGSRRVSVTNCILDVNNTTWDALSIRGAQDVTVSNCIGRRGRNGCQVFINDQASLDRGEDARRVTFSNNIWEFNDQNGLAVVGARNVSVTGDIARNNGESGFIVIQKQGVRRATVVTLSSVQAFDDQDVPTQKNGMLLAACDTVRVSAPVMYGNVNGNKVQFIAGSPPTDIDITGEGADGSTHKLISGSTGVVPANGSVVVTLSFVTPFQITSNWAGATLEFGSAQNNLRIRKVTGVAGSTIQVDVENVSGAGATGTVHAEARLLL